MKRLSLMLFFMSYLLLPQNSNAGTLFSAERENRIAQPAKTIERVSKRTLTSLTFEKDSIGSGKFQTIISPGAPLCYDSAGIKKRIDLTERPAKTKGYNKLTRVANSIYEYNDNGRMRYEKDGLWFETIPLFQDVKTQLVFSATGVKEYITLADTLHRLVWELNDPYGIARRKISPFTATDAAGQPVELIETRTDTSLSVRIKDATEVTWPVAIDPTVIDSVFESSSAFMYNSAEADYIGNRNGTTASSAAAITSNDSYYFGRTSSKFASRLALKFNLKELPEVISVDSATITFPKGAGASAADTVYGRLLPGTFVGAVATAWFNDFQGWQASGVYTPGMEYLADTLAMASKGTAGAGYITAYISSAGRDSIKAKMGVDTLHIMVIADIDFQGINGSDDEFWAYPVAAQKAPYLTIYYDTGNPPGVSTRSDSLRPAVDLVVHVDSTGGANATSLTIKLWPINAGADDTITRTKSGSFGAGELIHVYCDSLPMDSLMYWKGLLTGLGGSSWTALDSFSTTLGGGTSTSVYVDGRRVDHVR